MPAWCCGLGYKFVCNAFKNAFKMGSKWGGGGLAHHADCVCDVVEAGVLGRQLAPSEAPRVPRQYPPVVEVGAKPRVGVRHARGAGKGIIACLPMKQNKLFLKNKCRRD